jgi:hypothetical protein
MSKRGTKVNNDSSLQCTRYGEAHASLHLLLLVLLTARQIHDPHSVIQESPGPITTDSLAAESSRAGGAFSRNPNSEPQSVAGSNSTFTTTNTSGATRLDPASDAEARMVQSDWAEERKLSGGVLKYEAIEDSSKTAKSSDKTSQAKNDAAKGMGLHEGGLDSDDRKNASFNSEIGTENDPSRKTEIAFEMLNAGGDTGFPRQGRVSGKNPYETLNNDTTA